MRRGFNIAFLGLSGGSAGAEEGRRKSHSRSPKLMLRSQLSLLRHKNWRKLTPNDLEKFHNTSSLKIDFLYDKKILQRITK